MPPLLWAVAGTLLGSLVALVPALHVYNVAALILLLDWLPPEPLAMLFLGMVVAYSLLNSVPSVLLAVPDDSTVLVLPPSQRYLMDRRGYEAVVLTGAGGLGGLLVLVLLAPVASRWLPVLRSIVQPHLGWILAAVSLFMLMSEWPRGGDRASSRWGRFVQAWRGLAAGLLTFLLAGLLGFVLFYRPVAPAGMAFQNLLPAFIGLFAVPWLLLNLVGRVRIPAQHIPHTVDLSPSLLLRGVGVGAAGGLFAALFPAITGGIGGLLAGQATAQRDDRLFLVSQGASKVTYYVGAYLFFFFPGQHLTRGGLAWLTATVYTAYTPQSYWQAVGAIAVCGSFASLLLLVLARPVARWVGRAETRWLSVGTLLLLLLMVGVFAGLGGLAVLAVASAIGLLPPLWGSRRVNCMGVLLLPMTLNLMGLGPLVARWLGLS